MAKPALSSTGDITLSLAELRYPRGANRRAEYRHKLYKIKPPIMVQGLGRWVHVWHDWKHLARFQELVVAAFGEQ